MLPAAIDDTSMKEISWKVSLNISMSMNIQMGHGFKVTNKAFLETCQTSMMELFCENI